MDETEEALKTVVVLGKGTLAIHVASWFAASPDYRLIMVVPVIPEPSWTESFAEWARSNGVASVEDGHFRSIEGFPEGTFHVDLAVSVFYDKIISKAFIDSCGQILNIHNSPLPKYRGVSPINWALKNGESLHGVTIHEITPGIDDGPIIAQVTYSIYPEKDEVRDVYARALEFARTLFDTTMPILDRIEPRAQDESQATYYNLQQNVDLGDRRGFTRAESI